MMKFALPFFLASAALWGCKKDSSNDPVKPELKLVSVSATNVAEFDNAIEIVFSYEDYQGDLGSSDPDALQLSVKDSRLENADGYHIPPMTPKEKELHIKGNYTLTLRPLFRLGDTGNETTNLTLTITDRAGNVSNAIETGTITITP